MGRYYYTGVYLLLMDDMYTLLRKILEAIQAMHNDMNQCCNQMHSQMGKVISELEEININPPTD
jgi:hypothetical protein